MTTIPAKRTHLTMPEVMERWEWSENDLREALIHSRLVPSCFISKAVWPMQSISTTKKESVPAEWRNTWMYLINFKQKGAHDGYFYNVADCSDAATSGTGVFKIDGNGYTKDHLIRLAFAMSNGVVMMDQILRFEAMARQGPDLRKTDPKRRWWVEDYDIVAMAKRIEADASAANWGINQSGKRAGKYPVTRIAEFISTEIENAEKAANRAKTISAKSIANYLKDQDWV